jgi:hypothetical protein
MSSSKFDSSGVFQPVTLRAQTTELNLHAGDVRFHKNGIEFRTANPIPVWTEMTVSLQSVDDPRKVNSTGVIVACNGNRHSGYKVSMVFTHLTRQAQQRLGLLAFNQAQG